MLLLVAFLLTFPTSMVGMGFGRFARDSGTCEKDVTRDNQDCQFVGKAGKNMVYADPENNTYNKTISLPMRYVANPGSSSTNPDGRPVNITTELWTELKKFPFPGTTMHELTFEYNITTSWYDTAINYQHSIVESNLGRDIIWENKAKPCEFRKLWFNGQAFERASVSINPGDGDRLQYFCDVVLPLGPNTVCFNIEDAYDPAKMELIPE